jgi:hypothetical protein
MKIVLRASILLFVIACCLPALEFKNSHKPNDLMWGANALVVGWSGIFAGVMAWYANPFWMLGLFFGLIRKPWLAALAGVIAVTIACTTFSYIGRELPGDEGNITRTTIIRVLPGCYIWMASFATLILAALTPKPK